MLTTQAELASHRSSEPASHKPSSSTRSIGIEILLRRLKAKALLDATETDLVLSLAEKPKVHAAGTLICPREDGSPYPRIIVSGWACRPRMLPDGRRQMLSVLLPGDVLGDRGGRRPLTMTPAVALTQVHTIGAGRLFSAVAQRPDRYRHLEDALTELERLEENHLLDHVMRLGCQTAVQRIAHCLLELHTRLTTIGFTHNDSFPMPLTQETLGDLLGLSLVHVNRVISRLRRQGLVEIRGGVARLFDFGKLALIADHPDPA